MWNIDVYDLGVLGFLGFLVFMIGREFLRKEDKLIPSIGWSAFTIPPFLDNMYYNNFDDNDICTTTESPEITWIDHDYDYISDNGCDYDYDYDRLP